MPYDQERILVGLNLDRRLVHKYLPHDDRPRTSLEHIDLSYRLHESQTRYGISPNSSSCGLDDLQNRKGVARHTRLLFSARAYAAALTVSDDGHVSDALILTCVITVLLASPVSRSPPDVDDELFTEVFSALESVSLGRRSKAV